MKKLNFEDLSFHDCKLYALGFDEEAFELLLDIDFITQQIQKGNVYQRNIIPTTLVFSNVWDIEIDMSTSFEFIINDISRSNPKIPRNIEYLKSGSLEYEWYIDLLQGSISFKSIELKMYERRENSLQYMSMKERGYISLDKTGAIFNIG